jgi:hypothetical protein
MDHSQYICLIIFCIAQFEMACKSARIFWISFRSWWKLKTQFSDRYPPKGFSKCHLDEINRQRDKIKLEEAKRSMIETIPVFVRDFFLYLLVFHFLIE